jgi:CDGSH iron-sulfur domain-containing protein 3
LELATSLANVVPAIRVNVTIDLLHKIDFVVNDRAHLVTTRVGEALTNDATTIGDLQPPVASPTPFRVELLAGYRYAWCACGLSKYQPFCDGSHTNSPAGIKPVIWTQDKDQTAMLCGCKRTKHGPICDQSHRNL